MLNIFVERKRQAREAILKRCGIKPAKSEEEPYFSGGKVPPRTSIFCLLPGALVCVSGRTACSAECV